MTAEMSPAFRSAKARAMFGVILAFFLLLPVVVARKSVLPLRDIYLANPDQQGCWSYMTRETFDEVSPIDILFVGNSMLWAAIDCPVIESKLSARMGRPVHVVCFGTKWAGADITYLLTRELINRRQVGAVVMNLPASWQPADEPHLLSYRWLRLDDKELMDGPRIQDTLIKYGELVLGSPRRIIELLRPSRSGDYSVEASTYWTQAVKEAPSLENGHKAPDLSAPSIPDWVIAKNSKLAPASKQYSLPLYQLHYAKLLTDLVYQRGIPVAILHIPRLSDMHQDVIETPNSVQDLGSNTLLLGASPNILLAGLTDQQIRTMWYDDGCNYTHMSPTGRRYFSAALTPALEELLESKKVQPMMHHWYAENPHPAQAIGMKENPSLRIH